MSPHLLDFKEDFKVFYRPNLTEDTATNFGQVAIEVSTNQEATHIPEGMVI